MRFLARKWLPWWALINAVILGLAFSIREPIFSGLIRAPLLVVNFPGSIIVMLVDWIDSKYHFVRTLVGPIDGWKEAKIYAAIEVLSFLLFWAVFMPLVTRLWKKLSQDAGIGVRKKHLVAIWLALNVFVLWARLHYPTISSGEEINVIAITGAALHFILNFPGILAALAAHVFLSGAMPATYIEIVKKLDEEKLLQESGALFGMVVSFLVLFVFVPWAISHGKTNSPRAAPMPPSDKT